MKAGHLPTIPTLIVFDLDACLWSPEMFELSAAPTAFDAAAGGVKAGHDVVRLFSGAAAVLRRLLTDSQFADVRVAVASSTTEPAYANRCIETLPIDANGARQERLCDLVEYRQIYPGSKGRQHFPALQKQSGVPYDQMLFFVTAHCSKPLPAQSFRPLLTFCRECVFAPASG